VAWVVAIASAGAAGLRAQQTTPPPPAGDPPMYRLTPGDAIDLKFDYIPELNDTIRVRPDGYISAQRVGEIRVMGLTAGELTEQLRERYAAVVKQPELTVIVREFAVQRIFVGGEVVSPGMVPLHGQVTCLQAILATGGPRTSARLSEVVLLRHIGENQAEAYTLDLTKVVAGTAQDTVLRPFDVVVVPRSRIAKVGQFVEQYINALLPRSIVFPYNLNTVVVTRVEQ
jgi:polysaccharide export outer membrane protein